MFQDKPLQYYLNRVHVILHVPRSNEDTMPTCSIEGVHPSILSIVGGIEVAEAVKIIIGKNPTLSERILHIDLENLDFNSTRTFRADECPVCGNW